MIEAKVEALILAIDRAELAALVTIKGKNVAASNKQGNECRC